MGNNLGHLGPRGFKSRSMQSFQEAEEGDQTKHKMAPIGYQKALKDKAIEKQDVPCMACGGSWDDSAVHGAKRAPWLKSDKKYASGGYLKKQSVSILGSGPGFDWTGSRSRETNTEKQIPGLS